MVRPPVAVDLKKGRTCSFPKKSAFKVFDEKFEPKSQVPVGADTINSGAKRHSLPKVLHFVTFYFDISIFINASVSKILLFSGMKKYRISLFETPPISRYFEGLG